MLLGYQDFKNICLLEFCYVKVKFCMLSFDVQKFCKVFAHSEIIFIKGDNFHYIYPNCLSPHAKKAELQSKKQSFRRKCQVYAKKAELQPKKAEFQQ